MLLRWMLHNFIQLSLLLCYQVMYKYFFLYSPDWRLENSDVSPVSGIQGCHLIPLYYLLSSSSAYSYCSFCPFFFFFFPLLPTCPFFFPENCSIFFLERQAFQYPLVQQLGGDSWSVVCAACCHVILVFAIMHLYNFVLFLSISFLYIKK